MCVYVTQFVVKRWKIHFFDSEKKTVNILLDLIKQDPSGRVVWKTFVLKLD